MKRNLFGVVLRAYMHLTIKEKLEIIIVDGLSTDQTDIVARELGATVISNVKQTVSPGRNIGFENAKGELIAFTDADCIVDKNG